MNNHPKLLSNLGFSTVLDTSNSFTCNNNFFKNSIFSDKRIISTIASQEFNKIKHSANEDFICNFNYEKFKVYLYLMNQLDKDEVSPLMAAFIGSKLREFNNFHRKTNGLPSTFHHSGPCVSGARKLFVDVNGNFFPCERLSECVEDLIIGNVINGFYMDKVYNVLNIGKLTEENCKNCWAINHCMLCVRAAQDNGKLTKTKKLDSCISMRQEVEENLKEYVLLTKLGFDLSAKEYELNNS